jgi:hypothetical protein
MVVMAIVAVLAGIMVPFAYKAWETAEIDTTRERMSALKKAMVGDDKLVQNGVRTDFGFVGQTGQLPETLAELVTGGYIGAGFDPAKAVTDVWGQDFEYTPVKDIHDRWTSAAITSKGSDRTEVTADDITLQVDVSEVTPTDNVQGNLELAFSTPPQNVYNYSARVRIEYRDGSGAWKQHDCNCSGLTVSGSAGNTQVLYPGGGFSCTAAEKLPVGIIKLRALLFSDGSCSAAKATGEEMPYGLHDRTGTIMANLHISSVEP